MTRLCEKLVSVGLVLALFTGCATTGTATGSSSTSNDSTRTKVEGTAIGALLGAAVGAGIGYALGGKKGALAGAAVGAGTGGIGGYMLGSTVAERKQKYASEEDRLIGEIQVTEQYNAQLKDYNAKIDTRIKSLKQEVAYLKSHYHAGKVQISALQKKQVEIKSSVKEGEDLKNSMNAELQALNEYAQSIKSSQQETKVSQLEQEIVQLKENIQMLDGHNKELAQLDQSLSVGSV